jgi:hypothetical protein
MMTTEKTNPANGGTKERRRIPMSVPVQKLEVPEIPGYHLHWFVNDPARIKRALDGWYEFVEEKEIETTPSGLGSSTAAGGNTDLGSRVSIVAGKQLGKDGQPERLVLMKIKDEYYQEDQQLAEQGVERIAASLRGGMLGSEQDARGDTQQRYVDQRRTKIPDMFTPKRRNAT